MKIFLKKYWVILLIGLILRLVIAGVTYHPDIKPQVVGGVSFLMGQMDPYQYGRNLAPYIVLDKLPLSYLLELPFRLIFRPLSFSGIENTFFLTTNRLFGDPALMIYLIYAKLPMIIADLLLGVLLAMAVKAKSGESLKFWIFNPFSIWVTSAIGQIDVYIAVSIIVCWLLIEKGRFRWAALALGVGGAIKSGPFLLLPFLLGMAKNTRERVIMIIISIVPFIVSVLPFLPSRAFRQDALFSPQLSKILYATIPISGGEVLMIVPTLVILIYIFFFSRKPQTKDFLKFSIITLLVVFSFTHFHLQWFLWLMPLLIIWFAGRWDGMILSVSLLSISLIGMLFLFDSSLQFKLFAPLFPSLDHVKGFAEILTSDQVTFYRSIFASIFAASSFFIIWKELKENHES